MYPSALKACVVGGVKAEGLKVPSVMVSHGSVLRSGESPEGAEI